MSHAPTSVSIIAAFFLLVASRRAHAYLDLGTGSYVLQIFVAGILGSLVLLKSFWKNLLNVFKRHSCRRDETDAIDSAE
jgi:hypothetical protein